MNKQTLFLFAFLILGFSGVVLAQVLPTATISIYPTLIQYNTSSTITMWSKDATICGLGYYDDQGSWHVDSTITPNATTTSSTGNLTTSFRTYYFNCSNNEGSSGWKSADISVCPPGSSVVNGVCTIDATISVYPSTILYNGTSTINMWSTEASLCGLGYYDSQGQWHVDSSITPNATVSTTTPSLTSFRTYYFNCTNSTGGTGWKYADINVCAQGQRIVNGQCTN